MENGVLNALPALLQSPITTLLVLGLFMVLFYGGKKAFQLAERGLDVVQNNTEAMKDIKRGQDDNASAMCDQSKIMFDLSKEVGIVCLRSERIENDVSMLKGDVDDLKATAMIGRTKN